MSVAAGTRLGPYEILSALGAGGMGEVYRARDTTLGRDVALKVLPDAFTRDPDRLARFKREAKVLASLNHPNIAAIYGFEESDGVQALVLELVEGPTLADRIAQAPIPLDEATGLAQQIAEALEAAHEQGIVHRDLKPANIKLRPDGTVKVLDFGLAKALEPMSGGGADATASPTITSPAMTQMGVILGTAAYMSPEQAKGRTADKRSDVWAFGCVLYEVLTGKRAFEGEDVSEILADVLKGEPDWNRLPAETPENIRRLLRRCLNKDRKRRLQHLGDARIEIDDPVNNVPQYQIQRTRLTWSVALSVVTAIAGFFVASTFPRVRPAPEMRLEITTPPTTNLASLAISPDGQKIVFVATSEGGTQLWLRPLDSASARPLAKTEGASAPFWSPDNISVGFFADGKLKTIDIEGGSVRALANAPAAQGGTWNRGGTILFAALTTGPIFRTSVTGTESGEATRLAAPGQKSHSFPHFLPDGHHFLYYVDGTAEARGVYVGQLEASETQRILDSDGPALYASSGHLFLVRQGTLFAQRFDPVRLAVSGNPFQIADGVLSTALSVSDSGHILYRGGSADAVGGHSAAADAALRQLVWFDRSGKELEKIGSPWIAWNPSISPDGRRLAVQRVVNGKQDVWLLETTRGAPIRFTSDPSIDASPVWSPDGSRIVFSSNRSGVFDLYEKSAGGGTEKLLLATPQVKVQSDWSADGRFLLYRSIDPKMGYDLWALPFDGDRKPFPVVQTNSDERDGQFSPDGKWIAYQSNESGKFEIYVQPFTTPDRQIGGKWLVSSNGGAQVRWRRDGKELFYIALDGRLMAVPIQLASDGQAVEVSAPVPLFLTHIGGAVQATNRQQYIVSPDGQRFLMNTVTQEAAPPITIILNWAGAKR